MDNFLKLFQVEAIHMNQNILFDYYDHKKSSNEFNALDYHNYRDLLYKIYFFLSSQILIHLSNKHHQIVLHPYDQSIFLNQHC